jgi:hypothetical protein
MALGDHDLSLLRVDLGNLTCFELRPSWMRNRPLRLLSMRSTLKIEGGSIHSFRWTLCGTVLPLATRLRYKRTASCQPLARLHI